MSVPLPPAKNPFLLLSLERLAMLLGVQTPEARCPPCSLRCRCKHKHTEHDPASRACAKAGCACGGFDSPFVCK